MVTAHSQSAARRWEAVAVFAVLLGAAWWTFGRALEVLPLGGDNLYALGWVNRSPAFALLYGDPVIYPEWRPLAYGVLWLQYRLQGLDHLAAYPAFNMLLWVICVWLVYQIAVRLTSSRMVALMVAGLLLTDVRAVTTQMNIIERQTTLATIFGLSAIWIAIANSVKPLSRPAMVAMGALCLASALSKEYGLAFAAAVGLYGVLERRRDLQGVAAVSTVIYVAMRWSFAHGATGLYCEYMGYFFQVRHVCYDGLTATGLSQMTYNVVATGVGTVLPGLLTADGQIAIAPLRLTVSTVLLAVAAVGWARGPRELRLATLVMLFNTLLNFMVYGGRNQLAAVCAFGVVLAAGCVAVDRVLRARSLLMARAACVVALAAFLGVQSYRTRVETGQQVDDSLQLDPCTEIQRTEQHDPVFIRAVKHRLGLPDPDCDGR